MTSRVRVEIGCGAPGAPGAPGEAGDRSFGQVLGPGGEDLHRWVIDDVVVPRVAAGEDCLAGIVGVDSGVLGSVDDELRHQGWSRTSAWDQEPSTASLSPRRWEATVAGLAREPLERAGLRALDMLDYLTRVAHGPVTAAALVPYAVPHVRSATFLLRRLVAAGHVRVVGSTGGSVTWPLYAVVGTRWAPDRDEP